ncbi:BQ5605_C009g05417 [Microbotryum silenes-dioicae]|uniref:BQ5605_C009g05417 protein n=1 Tax=Microbotryum silenes-dioicae TaxID=796604 RepID=A0A2X0MCW9_9BASI|nr:BQ5605_C009g05417 [Microbotryum silenes-dioicae]
MFRVQVYTPSGIIRTESIDCSTGAGFRCFATSIRDHIDQTLPGRTPLIGASFNHRAQGTFAFRARQLIDNVGTILHQPWHDIESLVYVIRFVVFTQPTGLGSRMSEVATARWNDWNSELWRYDFKEGHIWISGKAFLIALLLMRSTADSVRRFLLAARSQKVNG